MNLVTFLKMLGSNKREIVPESEVYQRSLGGIFLDREAGPGDYFSGWEVLDFDGDGDDADEVDGVPELLLPRNLGRLRVRRRCDGALQAPQPFPAPCSPRGRRSNSKVGFRNGGFEEDENVSRGGR